MAIDYYGKKTSLINPYGSSSGNTEASMRDEMIDTLEGKYPEIAKGQTHLFRKMRRTSSGGLVPCPCVDVTTNEPDKDRFCPICLDGDSFILTQYGYKELKNILLGEFVLTKDGSFKEVIDKQLTYSNDLISIKSRLRSDPIVATTDHRFFVIKKENALKKNYLIEEAFADELKLKDLLILPKPFGLFTSSPTEVPILEVNFEKYLINNKGPRATKNLSNKIQLTPDFLWAIGLYIAEGCVVKNRSIIYTLHIEEKEFSLRLERVFKTLRHDLIIHHIERPEVKTRNVIINNSVLARWIEELCGKGCQNKEIPFSLLKKLTPLQSMDILKGIHDGDGCITKDKDNKERRYSIGMTSRRTIYTCQLILLMNGFHAGLCTHQSQNRKRVFSLEWVPVKDNNTRQFYEFDTFWATEITSLENDFSILRPMYDITVKDNHSFIANNTLTHNCYGEGNLFDESYILLYRILVAPDYGNSVRDKILPPGILNVPLAIFYTRYDELITEQDKIVLVNQNLDGTVVTPVRRRELYKIAAAWDYRADNGKLEYWKLFVHKEVVKYMNPPGFDTTTNDL